MVLSAISFSISPNPVCETFEPTLPASFITEQGTVEIFDFTGKVVAKYTASAKKYNASNLRSGVYFAKIGDGRYSATVKLIKR